MSDTKPKTKLPAALVLHDVDVASVFAVLSDQLTLLSGNVHPLHDVECCIDVDMARGRASLRFRAC
ncbi:hypothetical protein [Ensifer canadensis]